jgi:hypothetical protein
LGIPRRAPSTTAARSGSARSVPASRSSKLIALLRARLVACEQLDQALVWMPTTLLSAGQCALKHSSRRPSGYTRIGGFPGPGWAEAKDAPKSPPVARVDKSWETQHNCNVPSLSAVTAPLTFHQPLSPMDASPVPSPSPSSPSSPVWRTSTRTLFVIDCDPEDLGKAAVPIGRPAELALRRPSSYAMMRARP